MKVYISITTITSPRYALTKKMSLSQVAIKISIKNRKVVIKKYCKLNFITIAQAFIKVSAAFGRRNLKFIIIS
ncbi:hypothetical protein SAMN05880574_10635 [Chryseobacterium sp. RU37D]|nr:hypothetical protein SAMN05880574_10635 [Chryseobacterium sp. RU37D]